MTEHVNLDEATRATLERLVNEYGMKTIAEHTGLSTPVIAHAIKQEGHGITFEQAEAIAEYLKGRV